MRFGWLWWPSAGKDRVQAVRRKWVTFGGLRTRAVVVGAHPRLTGTEAETAVVSALRVSHCHRFPDLKPQTLGILLALNHRSISLLPSFSLCRYSLPEDFPLLVSPCSLTTFLTKTLHNGINMQIVAAPRQDHQIPFYL